LQVNLLLHCLQAQFQFTVLRSQTIRISLLITIRPTKEMSLKQPYTPIFWKSKHMEVAGT
jgi:hypothetical protein